MRTVFVSPVGTAGQNGTALAAAMAAITTASASNPWLLKIEPGVYDVGTSSLNMKPFVDVEGSGELTTTIRGHGNAGTVRGAGPSEIRLLTVENTGGSGNAFALQAYSNCERMSFDKVTFSASNGTSLTRAVSMGGNCAGATFTNVTAIATGGETTLGVAFESAGATPLLQNVRILVSGASSYNQGLYLPSGGTVETTSIHVEGKGIEAVVLAGGAPYLNGVTIEAVIQDYGSGIRVSATGGVGSPSATIENSQVVLSGAGSQLGITTYLDAGTTTIRRSTISASTGVHASPGGSGGVFVIDSSNILATSNTVNIAAGYSARIGASQLAGGPALGNVTCVGVYDENYASVGVTGCP